VGGSDIFISRRCDFRVVVCCHLNLDALAGARGVSVCHRAFVRALVLSMWFVAWDTFGRVLWSRVVI
jgi:hypothetical protein